MKIGIVKTSNDEILDIIGRKAPIFDQDINERQKEILEIINKSSFLVIGGAGSIGKSVVTEIFKGNLAFFMLLTSARTTLSSLYEN